ncbi:MAG TPA: universal stress protein [Acidocella sp.]|uniref:universal stress protein n=1 Tax=Acidocella sp. TaxID=50710 RepID=UPI002C8A30EF|nr:universal stress protein [Acidocella sp.]HVE23209.1 universal stress protein [Acidocella sp.]
MSDATGYATMMVRLQLADDNTALLSVAIGLAKRFEARLIGVAVCRPMQIVYGDGYVMGDLIRADQEQIQRDLHDAKQVFDNAVQGLQAEWRGTEIFAGIPGYLAEAARAADLVIIGHDRGASLLDPARRVENSDLVMQAGRPVLVVPHDVAALKLDHALVGWTDTRETRRAVRDALPFLARAGQVTLVAVVPPVELDAATKRLADVQAWLQGHGIKAGALTAAATGDDAIRLNAIAREHKADLLVAGAYGHSRLREWVLGGVTHDLLLRAERCVLVSH